MYKSNSLLGHTRRGSFVFSGGGGGGGGEFHYHSLPGGENLIQQINHYPPDKSQGNQLRYPIHWIVIYPVDSVI